MNLLQLLNYRKDLGLNWKDLCWNLKYWLVPPPFMNWTVPLVTTCSQLVERVGRKLSTSNSRLLWKYKYFLFVGLSPLWSFFSLIKCIIFTIHWRQAFELNCMRCQVLVILAVFDHQSMGHNLDMKGGKFLCKTWTRTDCPQRAGHGLGLEIVVNIRSIRSSVSNNEIPPHYAHDTAPWLMIKLLTLTFYILILGHMRIEEKFRYTFISSFLCHELFDSMCRT